jgi:hypothetical protein
MRLHQGSDISGTVGKHHTALFTFNIFDYLIEVADLIFVEKSDTRKIDDSINKTVRIQIRAERIPQRVEIGIFGYVGV